jgi:hypothetical protein
MRYLKVASKYQPPVKADMSEDNDPRNTLEPFREIIDQHMGSNEQCHKISKLGKLPLLLYNLPHEFERWRKHYGKHGKNIKGRDKDALKKPAQRLFWAVKENYSEPEDTNEDDPDDSSYEMEPETPDTPDDINDAEIVTSNVFITKDGKYVERDVPCDNTKNGLELGECVEGLFMTTDSPGIFEPVVPFDVELKLHHTILNAARYRPRKESESFKNHRSWDPVFLVDGMMNGSFDFTVADFYTGEEEEEQEDILSESTESEGGNDNDILSC